MGDYAEELRARYWSEDLTQLPRRFQCAVLYARGATNISDLSLILGVQTEQLVRKHLRAAGVMSAHPYRGVAGRYCTRYRDVLPRRIAQQQESWELRHSILRTRNAGGGTLKDIGDALGVSRTRALQMAQRAELEVDRGLRSPIEAYFAEHPLYDESPRRR